MKTRITELLGIEYPIVCAGMSGVATPKLAAAVSNAGGLGIINLTTLTPGSARSSFGKCDWCRDEVHHYGGKVVATSSTLKHAIAAQNQGADAVIVTSYEAAAHAEQSGHIKVSVWSYPPDPSKVHY